VLRVGHEGEVARQRLLDAADPVHLDRAVPTQDAAETLGQLAEDHPAAIPLTMVRGVTTWRSATARSPALIPPLSVAPSRTARRWASTVPSTLPFSSRVRARALRSPLKSPAISTTSATTRASTRAPSPSTSRPVNSI